MSADTADWQLRGACLRHPLGLYAWDLPEQPDRTEPAAVAAYDRHKAVNRRAVDVCLTVCPVVEECLRQAIADRATGVIRAGERLTAPAEYRPCVGCGESILVTRTNHPRRYCAACRSEVSRQVVLGRTRTGPGGVRRPSASDVERSRRVMAAARRHVPGSRIPMHTHAYDAGVTVGLVQAAVLLLRLYPEWVRRVDDGEVTVSIAVREARRQAREEAAA